MSYQYEQPQRNGPESHKLRMRTRHPIALAIHLFWPLLLDEALEEKIESFARELAKEHEDYFELARGPY